MTETKEITKTDVAETLASEIEKILLPCESNLFAKIKSKPHVILLAGVNGSGKTTTAGKIAENARVPVNKGAYEFLPVTKKGERTVS